jgi:hypothetical protein
VAETENRPDLFSRYFRGRIRQSIPAQPADSTGLGGPWPAAQSASSTPPAARGPPATPGRTAAACPPCAFQRNRRSITARRRRPPETPGFPEQTRSVSGCFAVSAARYWRSGVQKLISGRFARVFPPQGRPCKTLNSKGKALAAGHRLSWPWNCEELHP